LFSARSVNAYDLVHIRTVEKVEGVGGEFQPRFPRQIERAREADVPCLQAVALVRISREIPDAIGGRDEVIVGIEAQLLTKRCRASWFEVARSRPRRKTSSGTLMNVANVPSSRV
jgi:hypothetical protein